MLTYAEQQQVMKRTRFDGLYMFAACALILTLLCVAFGNVLDTLDARDQRALQALDKAAHAHEHTRKHKVTK